MYPSLRRMAALTAAVMLLVACGADSTETAADTDDLDLVTEGTLTVCSDVPYAPFEFEAPEAPTGYSGFDIELMEAIAAELELDIVVVATGFEGLQSGTTLAAGTCDIAATAMTITEERAQRIAFSDPYYDAVQSLLVPADSTITGIDDLVEGVDVGVQSATTGEAYAEENVPGAQIVSFENPGDLFVAMEAGQLDAILQDQPVNVEYARENSATVVAEFDTDEQYGFAMELGRQDGLVDAVNAALTAIRDAGIYQDIYDKYFALD